MNPDFSASRACAQFVSSLQYQDIPDQVIDFVKRDLLDWLGCAIGGSASPASRPIKSVSLLLGGVRQAEVIGLSSQNVVTSAACNAYFGHILEMDDVDKESISHPATVIMPAALAVGAWNASSGKDVITSIVAGFEVMLRIGASITPEHYKIFHTTATTGIFGASVAAGKILGLDEKRLLWALGNAGTLSCGLWQFLRDGGMSKFLHTAHAAGQGVYVALLAREGFSGATHILEGEQGFFKGYALKDVNCDKFEDFFKVWRSGNVSFKPYPCCRHTHSAIDAALDLREKLKGRKLKSIKLFSYSTAQQVAGKRSPRDQREAKFSTAYCVASAILRGLPSEKHFSEEALQDKEVRNLENLIKIEIDDDLNKVVPTNWPHRIEAITDDGERLVSQVWSPKGDPENELDWPAVESKFKTLTEGFITTATQEQVIEICRNFENQNSISDLFETINSTFQTSY